MSMMVARRLHRVQISQLLASSSRWVVYYDNHAVLTWYDNMVEEMPVLDEAMGIDDGENFDFDGNLDT